MTTENSEHSVVDVAGLPDHFPTGRHDPRFWEGLGRAVATFGFLEEMLAKAIFALTATRPYEEAEIQGAYDAWLPTLERALTDPLGNLINAYGTALRDHHGAAADDLEGVLMALRKAAEVRNVLCHGSWRAPDAAGASVPFFVNRKKQVFDTSIDLAFLAQVQRHTAELSCAVISASPAWACDSQAQTGQESWFGATRRRRDVAFSRSQLATRAQGPRPADIACCRRRHT